MLVVLLAGLCSQGVVAQKTKETVASNSLHLDVYVSQDGRWNVTSTLIYGRKESILIDAQYLKSDAVRLADRVAGTNTKLKAIIITHPHEDHYLGLETLHQRFPDTPIYINAPGLEVFKRWSEGEIDAIKKKYPTEAPESLPTPEVLPATPFTVDGERIEIYQGQGDEPGATNSYLWIPSLRALITGDIVFNDVHPWLGSSTEQSRADWLKSLEVLAGLRPKIVIGGHKKTGVQDSAQAIRFTAGYIRDHESARKTATNADEFIAKMKSKHPDTAQDWILELTAKWVFSKPKTKKTVAGELGSKLDAYLMSAADKGFSGAVLIVKDGQVILSKGYGLANRERKIPVTPDTVFDIGSLVKQFTAAAILKLEMKGKLRVTDPINKYFKKVPPDKASMTIHHLLTHTAGFDAAIGNDYDVISRDEYIKRALNTKLLSAPGEKYKYSNVGYSLLGAIVEMRSGLDYEHYVYKNLLEPAGITLIGYRIPKWDSDAIAHNYTADTDWGTGLSKTWAADGPYWNLRANGGMLFTVGEMYKWMQALAGEKILPKEVKEKYFTPYVKTPGLPGMDWFYGYGWRIEKTPRNTKVIWHGGDGAAFHSDARWFVDEDTIIIMATNVAEYKASLVSRQLGDIIFNKP